MFDKIDCICNDNAIFVTMQHCVTDIDECNTGASNCGSNAMCLNIPGTFMCFCNNGYRGDGVVCVGISN